MLQNQHTVKAAIYARRSPEDKANRTNMFRGGGVSDSIESQILELQQAAQRLGFPNVREYYDDNISGTTFIRKDFARLLEDIQAGTVNTVIVKDLSRLGRDYIESGRYQEIVFPEMGVRLIAVNDGYDSATGAGTDTAVFKNVFNDYYVRDISNKTRSALKARAKAGKYLSSGLYGYQKAPNDKNQLLPNPETAPVVQRIFSMIAGGHSFRSVARDLTSEGILTPAAYRGLAPRSCVTRPTDWTPTTVANIARDPRYLGIQVFGRTRKVSYKSKKLVPNSDDEVIVVDGTHEPLVTEEVWKVANEIGKRKRKSTKAGEPHIFAGLIFCADCGSTMVHSGHGGFVCRRYSDYNGTPQGCSSHRITDSLLYSSVWAAVSDVIHAAQLDRSALIERLSGQGHKKQKAALDNARKEQRKAEKRLNEIGVLIKKAFEKNALGSLPDDMYASLVAGYTNERNELAARLDKIIEQANKLEEETGNVEHFVNLVEKYIGIDTLDRELVHELIDRIEIGQSYKDAAGVKVHPMDIYFRFVGKIEDSPFEQ